MMPTSAANPATELVQIVDRHNRPTHVVPRHVMRQQGLIHRASYVFVHNRVGEIFVQKRTMTKDIFPGYWDLAAGGVMLAGETDEESASRELHEELGVTAELEYLFHHYYASEINKVWGAVYRCVHEGPFTLQKEEVAFGEFLSIETILARSSTEPFTPDGLEILARLAP